ncbi:hypothetical protein OAP05_07475 [Schleiferiaceae bacterium]|nr:hypothetical protein [Schleiferiaceae bacterium]MDC3217418.1 hypothetical protein [Schleiferiaceae bacterium]MDC3399964.1 hypothetical protein [Schleiferiaceae bacterium]
MKKPLPYDPRSLHLIYSSLLLLQLVVTSVVLYAAQENAVITFDIQHLTNTAAPVAAGLNAFFGKWIWTRGMLQLSAEDELADKLRTLTKVHIWQWVVVQFATILLLSYTLIEANFFYFIFALVNIIYFITLRPKIFTFNEGI